MCTKREASRTESEETWNKSLNAKNKKQKTKRMAKE